MSSLLLLPESMALNIAKGSVEEIRQRRSRAIPVLTYERYAPRLNLAAALLDGLF